MLTHEYIPQGEETAFVVYRRRRKMGLLHLSFKGDPREVLALKRSIPEFRNVSIVELAQLVRSRVLELGPYRAQDAVERAASLEREGLHVLFKNFVEEGDLLVDERGPVAHLIENESKKRRVIEDAIRRGVRIVEVEEP
jgi:hypothetical protein